jgi:hypothetical protein
MAKVVEFDFVARFVLIDVVVIHRPWLSQRRSRWSGTSSLLTPELPVRRIAMLQNVGKIDEFQRIIHSHSFYCTFSRMVRKGGNASAFNWSLTSLLSLRLRAFA